MGRCRLALAEPERRAAGRAVAARVQELPEYRDATRVALYVALADELPTAELVAALLASDRVLLLPRIAGQRLVFAAVAGVEALRRGPYGLLEPPVVATDGGLAASDLVLVPGVAFDRHGGRLGRGGGHYDRSLAAPGPSRPTLLGLAFDFQLVDAVPMEPHDVRVDGVITPGGVYRVTGRDRSVDPG